MFTGYFLIWALLPDQNEKKIMVIISHASMTNAFHGSLTKETLVGSSYCMKHFAFYFPCHITCNICAEIPKVINLMRCNINWTLSDINYFIELQIDKLKEIYQPLRDIWSWVPEVRWCPTEHQKEQCSLTSTLDWPKSHSEPSLIVSDTLRKHLG